MKLKTKIVLSLFFTVILVSASFSLHNLKIAKASTIFSDGFEGGNYNAWTGHTSGSGGSFNVSAPFAHSGSYGIQCKSTSATAPWAQVYYATNQSSYYARGYVNVQSLGIAANGDWNRFMVSQSNDGHTQIDVSWYQTGGKIEWELGLRQASSYVSHYYSTTLPTTNTWYSIEIFWNQSATTGAGILWVNGSQIISVTGQNTNNYGAMIDIYYGLDAQYASAATNNIYFDDFVLSSTYVGPELQQFVFSGIPATVTQGASFGSITVTAEDTQGNIANGYTGSVYFTSSDGAATLPYTSGSKYTYVSGDAGVHVFSGFTLNTVGTQTITVTDEIISQVSSGITVSSSDAIPPTFGTITANTTIANYNVAVSCPLSDNVALYNWAFAWNNTGSWTNSSTYLISGAPVSYTAVYNGTWTNHAIYVIGVQFWANDTSNNAVYSSIQYFTLTNSAYPETVIGITASQTSAINGVPNSVITNVNGVP